MTIDHDAIAARVRQNREAGTPGPWALSASGYNVMRGKTAATVAVAQPSDFSLSDARRISALPDLEAAYLALYDEVKRLRAERDAGTRTVPAGQTPLDDKLNHRFLDVIREGEAARDAGTASPYHGHSLEHCLHATGWVSRDLRLALDEARARAEKAEAERDDWMRACNLAVQERMAAEAERDALRAALESIAKNTCCEGCQEAALVARQALKGHTHD